MQTRIIQIIALALLVAFALPVAAAEDERAGDKTAFRAAYAAYQAAVEAKDAEAAVAAAKKALKLGKVVLAHDSPSQPALFANYGRALLDAKNHGKAIKPLKEAIRRYETLYGKNDERLIDPLWWLAEAYGEITKQSKALGALKRLRPLVLASFGSGSITLVQVDLMLGRAELAKDRNKAARIHFARAVDALLVMPEASPVETGFALHMLGRTEVASGQYEDAVGHLKDALLRLTPSLPADDETILYTLAYTDFAYRRMKMDDEASLVFKSIRARLGDEDNYAFENESGPVISNNEDYIPKKKKQPIYPRHAQMNGLSGWVLVKFIVTQEGRVKNPEAVLTIGGLEFAESAVAAARKFVFEPRKVDGIPVDANNIFNLITFDIAEE